MAVWFDATQFNCLKNPTTIIKDESKRVTDRKNQKLAINRPLCHTVILLVLKFIVKTTLDSHGQFRRSVLFSSTSYISLFRSLVHVSRMYKQPHILIEWFISGTPLIEQWKKKTLIDDIIHPDFSFQTHYMNIANYETSFRQRSIDIWLILLH